MKKDSYPFGLVIAVNQALSAIKNDIAPISVILGNLITLQKSKSFPDKLDEYYFSKRLGELNPQSLILVKSFLGNYKKPGFDLRNELIAIINDGWVKKIKEHNKKNQENNEHTNFSKKGAIKLNKPSRNIKSDKIITPVIVVKKNKILVDK